MTERLYYLDSSLYEFDAYVTAMVEARVGGAGPGRVAAVLDRTAFYPTSGGQLFDTGWLQPLPHAGTPGSAPGLRVAEVAEDEAGTIFHFITGEGDVGRALEIGAHVRGFIDAGRRRDHMQQHSGQHVLSAAFLRLFGMKTVGFHMGAESCTIDLDTAALAPEQVRDAVQLANEVIAGDRPVGIHFATRDEALARGIRKLPEGVGDDALRLIDVRDFDVTACGGTHVARTSHIGGIMVRGLERVKPGVRLEFVCGGRLLAVAQRDFAALSQAAAALSTHLWEVPQQVRKLLEQSKAGHKAAEHVLEELAGYQAAELLAQTPATAGGVRIVSQVYPGRDASFLKLLARKLTAQEKVVALLASTGTREGGLPGAQILFARSADLAVLNMGALLKELLSQHGGRGGGTAELAQGGLPDVSQVASLLDAARQRLFN